MGKTYQFLVLAAKKKWSTANQRADWKMHQLKQRRFFLKFDRHSFSQLYFHCQLYSTLPLCSVCSNSLITFYLLLFCKTSSSPAPPPTTLPTSTWKPLLRHSSAVLWVGTVLPRAEQGGTWPRQSQRQCGCVDGAQGTGIRGKSCWAASWLGGNGNGERWAVIVSSCSPGCVKEGFTPALNHSAWLRSPSWRSVLWNPAAEGKC